MVVYPFTEGNAWQYFWYVPQNIPDLIYTDRGKQSFYGKRWIPFSQSITKVVN